jgi:hypothetical protein
MIIVTCSQTTNASSTPNTWRVQSLNHNLNNHVLNYFSHYQNYQQLHLFLIVISNVHTSFDIITGLWDKKRNVKMNFLKAYLKVGGSV